MAIEKQKKNDEATVQELLNNCTRALHDRNIEGIMSLYAQEVVTFDIVPPLRHVGAKALRALWEEVFSVYQGPIDYKIHDRNIIVGDDLAFVYSLNRIRGTLRNEFKTNLWLRWTACFQRIDGKWLIVHHQNSVPVDLEHGIAVLDLKP